MDLTRPPLDKCPFIETAQVLVGKKNARAGVCWPICKRESFDGEKFPDVLMLNCGWRNEKFDLGSWKLERPITPGWEQWSLAPPGGSLEPGEEILVGAARETLEESGFMRVLKDGIDPSKATWFARKRDGSMTQVFDDKELYTAVSVIVPIDQDPIHLALACRASARNVYDSGRADQILAIETVGWFCADIKYLAELLTNGILPVFELRASAFLRPFGHHALDQRQEFPDIKTETVSVPLYPRSANSILFMLQKGGFFYLGSK